AWAVGEKGPAGSEVVERLSDVATTHDEPLCREAAIAALGAIGDERGLAAILAGIHDRATVRRRAVIALAPFAGAEVDAALRQARDDKDWQVRQAAEDLS
ncbi:MAG: HEAT repeat domain-containing protein, partial [Actinomycetota bacterium]|nr:HEAT repeat domain-containing protein [Actinomycetota bacterium]